MSDIPLEPWVSAIRRLIEAYQENHDGDCEIHQTADRALTELTNHIAWLTRKVERLEVALLRLAKE